MGAIEVDWRDLFPYLKWMPNNKFERRLMEIEATRTAVIKAMIREQKQLNNDIPGEVVYLHYMYYCSSGKFPFSKGISMRL